MGHPGVDAFRAFVEEAEGKGIIVTANNTPLPEFEATYGGNGFGYAGADLFEGGYVTGQQIIAAGNLQAGDRVLEYGLRAQPERGKSDEGVYQAFLDAGLTVDYIEITPEVDADATLCIPILTGYLASNPDCKAIGTQHGNVTSTMGEVVKAAGLGPDDIVIGGIDLSPKTVEALQEGYVDLVLDQVLYLQGYLPVTQIMLTKLYGMPGLHINTASGVVTSESIVDILSLIDEGIR
jgi:simple sugar transport system substrate-binding protein